MARSTKQDVVVARVSFESTRLSPQCLAEAYARIIPITKTPIGMGVKAAVHPITKGQPTVKGRTEHG